MARRHIAPTWLALAVLAWLPRAAAAAAAAGPAPAGPGPAAAPISLAGSAQQHWLMGHLDALLDPDGALDVHQVAARPRAPLERLDTGLGRWPGQRQPMVWLGFSILVPPGGTPDDWSLLIGRPFNPGTVYLEQDDGSFSAFALRLDHSGGAFRVELPRTPGLHRGFLRVPAPIIRPDLLHLATPAGQEWLLERHLITQGLYFGVMLAMLLINLLVGVLLRDRAQLWYVGFIATSVATFALLTGTASRFVLTSVSAAALYRVQSAGLALVVLVGMQFSRRFLDTARKAPRTDRVMRGFLALAALVALACFVVPDNLALRAVALLGLLVPLVALTAGVATLRAGSRWARFYLVGWSLFSLGGFIFASPIRPFGLDGLTVFQLSSALEAVLFMVALADRMRILRAERAEAERALVRGEKLSALGQLVAGVAHEVNNPNNFLTFNLPILDDYVQATRPIVEAAGREQPDLRLVGLTVDEFYADAGKLVGNMLHGAERITAIVAQLKSYVRGHDDAERQWESADLGRVASSAATLVRKQLEQWGITFQLELARALPPVRMNPGPIEQVVMNLVLNAGQAARTTTRGQVTVRTRPSADGSAVELTVTDNGPGVPEKLRTRIFEPFFTTRAGEQGTGMGLAISQRIVEEHHGTLELASAAPGDTCFVVRLPIPPPSVEQP
ncbi:MAG: hypothetical protein IT370_14790 [Deltaproteobacteria bacterium]|nr:hypothetical protein [Deltaproteobacteria bacterium]